MFVFQEITTAYGNIKPILIDSENLNNATKIYLKNIIDNNKNTYINYLFDLENNNIMQLELYETYLKFTFVNTINSYKLYCLIKNFIII